MKPGERAVLRRLAAGRAAAGAAAVACPALAEPVMKALERAELVSATGARARITELGRAALDRDAAPEAPNRWLVRRGTAARAPLMANLAESPLAWLMRRGMITPGQFAAGERLRGDHARAHTPPAVTMRWDGTPGGAGRGAPGGPVDPTLAQLDARRRFEAATAAVGAELGDVLTRVVCEGQGLEAAERAMGWPARAGKVVLGLALDRLASHYR